MIQSTSGNSGVAKISEWGAFRRFPAHKSWRAKTNRRLNHFKVCCPVRFSRSNTIPYPPTTRRFLFGRISRPVPVGIGGRPLCPLLRGYANVRENRSTGLAAFQRSGELPNRSLERKHCWILHEVQGYSRYIGDHALRMADRTQAHLIINLYSWPGREDRKSVV